MLIIRARIASLRFSPYQVNHFLRQHAVYVAVMVMIAISMFALPARATSFSIDTSTLLSNAASIFNGLWPAFAIIVGIGFGIGLLKFIVGAISHIF